MWVGVLSLSGLILRNGRPLRERLAGLVLGDAAPAQRLLDLISEALKRLAEGQIGPVTFAEIADGLASIDVNGGDPVAGGVGRADRRTIRRAAR